MPIRTLQWNLPQGTMRREPLVDRPLIILQGLSSALSM